MVVLLEGRETCRNTRLHRLTLTGSPGYRDKTRETLIHRDTARDWCILSNEYSRELRKIIFTLCDSWPRS